MDLLKSDSRFCAVMVFLSAAAISVGSVAVHKQDRLLLMDTDKSGKISRPESMNFMAAEFDRLDKDKSGDLGVKDARSQVRVSHRVNR